MLRRRRGAEDAEAVASVTEAVGKLLIVMQGG